jgi:V/A-type H+-transporting ATPase subunit I
VGDAGYGAIMLIGTLLAGLKGFKKPALRPLFIILTVFCLSTIGWGILSGTYFGIAKEALPACLANIPTVQWLGDNDNIMFLCFLIGAIHISVARLWNAILLAPNLKAIGEIGWLGVTWSMFMIVCNIVVSWFVSPEWTLYLLSGSIGLILIALISDIKNEAINIGMLPLNVISSMGDIISYVRLFAVGLASVKVAENFNTMATGLEMGFAAKIIAMSAILLVGHGLNLAMGALSILVHAVRLNTLEFSNAKGITWAGMPYTPFKNTSQNTSQQ